MFNKVDKRIEKKQALNLMDNAIEELSNSNLVYKDFILGFMKKTRQMLGGKLC